MIAAAQILDQGGQALVVEDGFNFLEEAVQRTVNGEKGFCFVCGERANNPGDFICPVCFKGANKEEAGRGVSMARAAISAFIKAGGTVEHQQPQEPNRIDNDFFHEIIHVGKVWLFKNQNATVKNLHEYLVFLYNKVDKGVLGKATGMAFKFYKAEVKAAEAVLKWYKKNPDDFRNPSEVGRDIMTKLKPEAGEKKIVKAVWLHQNDDDFQRKRKSWVFQRCEGAANSYLGKTFDNRRPGEIAQEIIDNRRESNKDSLPPSMLTKAVANHLDKLRQAERKRLTANYGGQKVKKPGSVAKRHNGHSSKVRMAGAKKRGVKG